MYFSDNNLFLVPIKNFPATDFLMLRSYDYTEERKKSDLMQGHFCPLYRGPAACCRPRNLLTIRNPKQVLVFTSILMTKKDYDNVSMGTRRGDTSSSKKFPMTFSRTQGGMEKRVRYTSGLRRCGAVSSQSSLSTDAKHRAE